MPSRKKPSASAHIRAAEQAASELTANVSSNAEIIGNFADALRESLATFSATYNKSQKRRALRITRLDAELEYGVNYQPPGMQFEIIPGAVSDERTITHGMLHIQIGRQKTKHLPVTLGLQDNHLIVIVTNPDEVRAAVEKKRSGADDTKVNVHAFFLSGDMDNPSSYRAIDQIFGGRSNQLETHPAISFIDFLKQTINTMIVDGRRSAPSTSRTPT